MLILKKNHLKKVFKKIKQNKEGEKRKEKQKWRRMQYIREAIKNSGKYILHQKEYTRSHMVTTGSG